MGWLWRRIQRHAPVIAGAVVVVINLIALSGVLKLSDKVLGGINAAVAACLALIVAFLVSIQPYRVRRAYTVGAQRKPLEVAPGTGSLTGAVVGRETLCDVLMDDLRSRHTRRPYVVVGGSGAGKTALLVRLTSKLAAQGYVPVPIALRDAQENLDFREMARARFVGNEELAAPNSPAAGSPRQCSSGGTTNSTPATAHLSQHCSASTPCPPPCMCHGDRPPATHCCGSPTSPQGPRHWQKLGTTGIGTIWPPLSPC